MITQLNALLKNQLTGINQYFLHARMLKHQGIVKLADYEYKASIDAMKHADMLVEHILTLGGMPQLHELGTLSVGTNTEDMMSGDLAHAIETLELLKTTVDSARENDDETTLTLLTRIADAQKVHVDFIRNYINQSNNKECA